VEELTDIRKRILEAAFDAFMEKGYAGTSTLEIATRAKVSKRDLYANFASKQAILSECIAHRSRSRMGFPQEMPDFQDRAGLEALLIEFGRIQLTEILDPAPIHMFRLAISEVARAPEVAQILAEQGRGPVIDTMRRIVVKAQEKGILKPGPVPERVAIYFSLMFRGELMDLVMGLREPPDAEDIRNRAKLAAELFLKLYA